MEPERERCSNCRKALRVKKTRKRTIITSSGPIQVVEVTRGCQEHPEHPFHPEQRLAPPKSRYGYDIIAETGRRRVLENKQIQEIHDDFRARGIGVPGRTVQWLADRFLLFVMAVHLEAVPWLSRFLRAQGGFALHVDGSGSSGPMVLLLRDGWSGIRLLAAQIRSEASEFVAPHLATIKQWFGDPVAAIRDLGEGIAAAVKGVYPGIYVIVCHYHFLGCVAKRLFEPFYPRFRLRVDRRGVKKRLRELRRVLRRRETRNEEEDLALGIAGYVLAYRKDGKGLSYPFSLPMVDFYRRCGETGTMVRKAILSRARKNISSPNLSRLENALRRLKPPPAVLGRLQADFENLEARWAWFQRVRRALRYRNGPIPLSTHVKLSDNDLERGREKLGWVVAKIEAFEREGVGTITGAI